MKEEVYTTRHTSEIKTEGTLFSKYPLFWGKCSIRYFFMYHVHEQELQEQL